MFREFSEEEEVKERLERGLQVKGCKGLKAAKSQEVGTFSRLELSQRAWPCQPRGFRHVASRAVTLNAFWAWPKDSGYIVLFGSNSIRTLLPHNKPVGQTPALLKAVICLQPAHSDVSLPLLFPLYGT